MVLNETQEGLWKSLEVLAETLKGFGRTASGLVKRGMGFWETARGFGGVAGICGVGGRGLGMSALGAVTGASRV